MNASLNELLKQNSRSFYLTLRVLPRAVRSQIGLAYLLARTTDTIADTDLVPLDQRLDALMKLRERILGTRQSPLDFSGLLQFQSSSAERVLLEKCEDAIAALRECSASDAHLIREVLNTITSGQELDLKRFEAGRAGSPSSAAPDQKTVIALRDDAELDDYTYRVAGCVGEFWTKMCRAHLFPNATLDEAQFLADGVRFGKGLQLVNILRDLPADLQKGRCYLPTDKLTEAGLTPADLLNPANEARLRPLYNSYLDLAQSHLAAGWKYTCLIPFTRMSLHLACAWPILIGIKTIGRLRTGHILDPRQRIKVPRGEVYRMMAISVLTYPVQPRWRRLFAENIGT